MKFWLDVDGALLRQAAALADQDHVFRLVSNETDFIAPRPTSLDGYLEYMSNSMKFVSARNARIADWVARN